MSHGRYTLTAEGRVLSRRRTAPPGACGSPAGSRVQWQSRAGSADEPAVAKTRAGTTRSTCPSCGQNAWAKADAALMCAPCQEIMVVERLTGGQGDDEEPVGN